MSKKQLLPLIVLLSIMLSPLSADTNLTKKGEPFDPFKDMHDMRQHILKMQEEMDKFFGDFHQKMQMDSHFDNFKPFKDNFFEIKPAIDFKDKGDFYEIKANISGADNKRINVIVEKGMLKIEATTSRDTNESKNDKFLKQERYMGSYVRILSLPKDADDGSMKNSYKDGVLTITIDKKKPKV
jgi:HSP20 family molecular chaperone IbpA